MKRVLTILLSLSLATPAFAQEDIDPEVMKAILDAQESSSADPVAEAIQVNPSSSQSGPQDPRSKAVDAARKLREQNVEVKPREVRPTVVKEVKKKPTEVITAEEAKMLEQLEKDQARLTSPTAEAEQQLVSDPAKKRKPIYVPAPVEAANPNAGFLLERDSTKILRKTMSPNDVLNVKICYTAGVTISLENDVQDEFQRVIIDENQYFAAETFENRKGVFVALKKPIPDGSYWESAIRLVRKRDDKTYLVNLIGLPCPAGLVQFPKVIYLKEHLARIQANNKVLTPEDMIIQQSKGMPKIQKNKIRIYDMVASSSSNWSVFGVEVQYPEGSKMTVPKMVVLDSFQVNKRESKLEYLPLPSKKATEIRGVPTLRFKLSVNIGKDYVLKNRYLHLMYLDEEVGHYQYIRIDTLPYFLSLVKRGFEL